MRKQEKYITIKLRGKGWWEEPVWWWPGRPGRPAR